MGTLGTLLEEETARLAASPGSPPSSLALLSMCSLVHLATSADCKEALLSQAWLARIGALVDHTDDYEVLTAAAAILQTSIQSSAEDAHLEKHLSVVAAAPVTNRLLHRGFSRLRSSAVTEGGKPLPSNRACLIEACEHLKPVGKDRSALLHRLRLGPDANLQMLATTTLLCSLSSIAQIRDDLLHSGLLQELNSMVSKWNPQLLEVQNYPCVSRLLYLLSLLVSNESVARYVVEHQQWTDHIQQLLHLDDPDVQLFTVILLGALMESSPGGVALLQKVGLASIVRIVDRMDVDVRNAVRHVLQLMIQHPELAMGEEATAEGPLGRFALDEDFNHILR